MWSDLIPVYSAAIAAAVAGLGVWVSRKQVAATSAESEASAAKITVESALRLIEPLNLRVLKLEGQVRELTEKVLSDEKRISFLEDGVVALQNQVRMLGHDPVWPPSPIPTLEDIYNAEDD